ncbi:potassium transporter KefB [Pontibacter sp. SGAir0037]|uniref:potassium transporter KefB n=1 Tax=Pontibacter sp. SGAir0037 TaxID=2571030 RepID=UPI0010CD18A2|nr:potassium transporter KefB [Pontibacter sp. SGAir0037]QCR22751.1 potassium transporter KefB [Pontibacter sp. SGAir0037]
MTQKDEFQNQPVHPASVAKRMLQGAAIGLILILFFLLGAGDPAPDWPDFWMVKPLLIVPLAGALGGVFYYNMDHLRCQGGWREVLAYILSLLVFIIVLWLGTVLGLNGTMWD